MTSLRVLQMELALMAFGMMSPAEEFAAEATRRLLLLEMNVVQVSLHGRAADDVAAESAHPPANVYLREAVFNSQRL